MRMPSMLFCVGILSACSSSPPVQVAIPECLTDANCQSPERCLSGYCLPPTQTCTAAADCTGYGKFSCIAVTCSLGACDYENKCQCEVDSDCPGYNQYTCVAISCVGKTCAARNSCPCNTAQDCDDHDSCTEDICTRNSGQQFCAHLRSQNCGASYDLAPSADLASAGDMAGMFPCSGPFDCNDNDPCTKDICELNGDNISCRHFSQACPPDLSVLPDQASAPTDLALATDVGVVSDAGPDDLTGLENLADWCGRNCLPIQLPDLITTPITASCKWTHNIIDGGLVFSSSSMSMKVNSGPMIELCENDFPSTSIMCSMTGLKTGDRMDISIEYINGGSPNWSCVGHGAQGVEQGVLTCVFSHHQIILGTWQKVPNGAGPNGDEGCNLRGFVP